MAERTHMFGERCPRTESHNHGRGLGKNSKPCSPFCFAGCDRALGCAEGMPWLSLYGRRQLLELAFFIREAVHASINGDPRDGDHVVYRDPTTLVAKRVQVVKWYQRTALICMQGTVGRRALGTKREAGYDKIVQRRDLKRITQVLSYADIDYIAERSGIIGTRKFRRKQVRFELRRIRRAYLDTRLPVTPSFQKCINHPETVTWGA